MSQYTIKVSPTLTDNSNYKALTDIPSDILTRTDVTVLMYPGTYEAPTAAVYSDIAFVGIGDVEEIVIAGAMTIANTSVNRTSFKNISFIGADANAAAGSACVTKLGAASAPLHFDMCNFSNAEHAVSHNGERAFATTTKQVVLNYCDASAVDQAVVANANVGVNWSALNTGSNAYFQTGGAGAPVITVTVAASTSGGSNTGNNTETVLGLIA